MWTVLALVALAFLAWFTIDTARLNYLWENDDRGEQPRCSEGSGIRLVGDDLQDTARYQRTLAPRPCWGWPGSLVFDWEDDPDLASDWLDER